MMSQASSLLLGVSFSTFLLTLSPYVLLRLGLILSTPPLDIPPVVHSLLVLLNAPVIHVRFLRGSVEPAGLHLRQHLRPPEIDCATAPKRFAPTRDDE